MSVKLTLPIPPANNRYYRHAKGRTYLSKSGQDYKRIVSDIVRHLLDIETITRPVSVNVLVYPRDKRRRDLDGYPKGIFDALTEAKVWEDDKLVEEMRFKRMPPDKIIPRVEVEITLIDQD